MAFELPALPYAIDALADFGMSRETLEYHHGIHHRAYVDALNKLSEGTEHEDKPLKEIVKATYNRGAIEQSLLFNNAAQHWNHSQFWSMMKPGGSKMPPELESALNETFGSIERLKETFMAAGLLQFGSGWVWLVRDKDDVLKVLRTENGVNPLCFEYKTLLGCDVWEHSYYIDFRNKRQAYVSNFFDNLVNWEYVASRL